MRYRVSVGKDEEKFFRRMVVLVAQQCEYLTAQSYTLKND